MSDDRIRPCRLRKPTETSIPKRPCGITCYMVVASWEQRARGLGLAGAAAQLALVVLLGFVGGRPDAYPNPPYLVSRSVVLAGLFAVPAIIGAIGAVSGRRSLLAAAAALSTIGSVLSFSGITLLFLVPALLFGAAAGASDATPRERSRFGLRTVAVLAVGTIGVIALSLRVGIFVIPMIVLLVLVLQVSRGVTRAGVTPGSLRGMAAALAIVALVAGAGVAAFAMTETRCWRAYETPNGIEYRDAPGTANGGTISLRPGEIGGGCDSGVPTMGGSAVASVLSVAAIGIATAGAHRPSGRTCGGGGQFL